MVQLHGPAEREVVEFPPGRTFVGKGGKEGERMTARTIVPVFGKVEEYPSYFIPRGTEIADPLRDSFIAFLQFIANMVPQYFVPFDKNAGCKVFTPFHGRDAFKYFKRKFTRRNKGIEGAGVIVGMICLAVGQPCQRLLKEGAQEKRGRPGFCRPLGGRKGEYSGTHALVEASVKGLLIPVDDAGRSDEQFIIPGKTVFFAFGIHMTSLPSGNDDARLF